MLAKRTLLSLFLTSALAAPAMAQTAPKRDEFFWLGEINKASTVINRDEGLLDAALAPRIAAGLDTMLKAAEKPGAKRPTLVITFEPILIETAGVEATLLHAGRSSQDMLSTVRAAMIRDETLRLAAQLRKLIGTMLQLAEKHAGTIVPNYTNGVAAQPNSYGHTTFSAMSRGWSATRSACARPLPGSIARPWAPRC